MADLFWTVAMIVFALSIAAGCVLLVFAMWMVIRREFWNIDGTPREKKDRGY